MISNVQALAETDGTVRVKANFLIHRAFNERLDSYPGRYDMTLVPGGDLGFRIRSRRSTLALERLRPHGRVTVIL